MGLESEASHEEDMQVGPSHTINTNVDSPRHHKHYESPRGYAGIARSVYSRLASENGLLVSKIEEFLADLSISLTTDYKNIVQSIACGAPTVSYEQLLAICGLLNAYAPNSPSSQSAVSRISGGRGQRLLTNNRNYLETGRLAYDDAVAAYMKKLDDHRRKCEAEGRYSEAKAAAQRLADLKTAQVERLRSELVNSQRTELEDVRSVYEQESAKFEALWDTRIKEYEANFSQAVNDLKAAHDQALEHHADQLYSKRPQKPKPSREYLNQKKIEESLAKVKQYGRASMVKEAADELYQAELQQAQQAFEVEQKLKVAKFLSKQQQEFEALLQRGARGRDELELRRVSETERRAYRFRNIVAELENLHRLEVVHLENFCEAHALAGKAVPLKGEGFRRKREQLQEKWYELSSPFCV